VAQSIEQLSFELTASALAEQERALTGLRTRAGTVLAAASIAGSFLGAEARAAFDTAFSLNTADELRRLATDAGLRKVHIRFEHRTFRYPVPAGLVALYMETTPITAQFAALPEDRRQSFVAGVVEQLAGYLDDDGLAIPMENHFLTASKPISSPSIGTEY